MMASPPDGSGDADRAELIVMGTNNSVTEVQRDAPRERGRPSVAGERRDQIVDAFIDLVAETGSAEVTITQVAERAGVHRSAVRHFIGNRSDLIGAAVDEICRRHDATRDALVGEDPTIEQIVDHYFSEAYIWGNAELDDVFGILLVAASRDDGAASSIADDYRSMLAELLEHLGDSPAARVAAYQVVCLVEQNVVMQRLGFDAYLNEATRRLAHSLVETAR